MIHIGETQPNNIQFYDVQAEVDEAKENPLPAPSVEGHPWALLFDPALFEKEHKDRQLDIYDQSQDQLEKTAVYVTQLRYGLRQKALQELHRIQATEGGLESKIKELGKRIVKG